MAIYMVAKKTFTNTAHPLLRKILSLWGVKIHFQKFRASIRNIRPAPYLTISHHTSPLELEWLTAQNGHAPTRLWVCPPSQCCVATRPVSGRVSKVVESPLHEYGLVS